MTSACGPVDRGTLTNPQPLTALKGPVQMIQYMLCSQRISTNVICIYFQYKALALQDTLLIYMYSKQFLKSYEGRPKGKHWHEIFVNVTLGKGK